MAMWRRQRIYLDTSVLSAYFDGRSPERRALTALFWERLAAFDTWISDLVLAEIAATDDRSLADDMLRLVEGLRSAAVGDDARRLADEYLRAAAVPASAPVDAVHVAVATLLEVDAVVSWNLRHLVRQRTRDRVNVVNARYGLRAVVLATPAEFLEDENGRD